MHVIRRAHADDASALTALMHASQAYQGRYVAMLQGYAVSAAQIARDEIYVYEENGDIGGFYALTGPADDAELDLLFVADNLQGQGVGARLVAHLRQRAQALGMGALCIVSHPPAEAFYLRMGAVRVGVRPASGRVAWDRPELRLLLGP